MKSEEIKRYVEGREPCFYVVEERTRGGKLTCNGLFPRIVFGIQPNVGDMKRERCGCDQSDDSSSWSGCDGYDSKVMLVLPIDSSFIVAMQEIFGSSNQRRIIPEELADEIAKGIEKNKQGTSWTTYRGPQKSIL